MAFQAGYSNPIRVLHVDDEPADLEITRIFLKREWQEESEIVSMLSAEKALDKLENEHFDVIIADYLMRGMDGIEFLGEVRKSEKHAQTPFILFTGKGGAGVAKEALNKGANRYISKAGNPASQCNDLSRAIRELVLVRGKMAGLLSFIKRYSPLTRGHGQKDIPAF